MESNDKIIIITGLSGSGKSCALKALEDIGFFCVDNLPIALLPQFLEIQTKKKNSENKIAIVMDIREPNFIGDYRRFLAQLEEHGYRIEILFLEAANHILHNRFSETRREHPLAGTESLEEKIVKEKESLQPLRERANSIIDSSFYNVHQLKERVQREYLPSADSPKLILNIYSFGFKNGLPQEANVIIDVRFLDNPHFVAALKDLKGTDAAVREYVLSFAETQEFLAELLRLLDFLLPRYEKEGKPHLALAFGCTSGKHRSVVVAEEIAHHLARQKYTVNTIHRDIGRG